MGNIMQQPHEDTKIRKGHHDHTDFRIWTAKVPLSALMRAWAIFLSTSERDAKGSVRALRPEKGAKQEVRLHNAKKPKHATETSTGG